jgi:hypothetical protein
MVIMMFDASSKAMTGMAKFSRFRATGWPLPLDLQAFIPTMAPGKAGT